MRATLLDWLPADMSGLRLLDAGCGTAALAVEAARRGAEVVAIDLSPQLVDVARQRIATLPDGAALLSRIDLRSGDMLDAALGSFDHVVAMDSLIHYSMDDAVRLLQTWSWRTRSTMAFTFAPRSPLLAAMRSYLAAHPNHEGTLPRAEGPALQVSAAAALALMAPFQAAFDLINSTDSAQVLTKGLRDDDHQGLYRFVSKMIGEIGGRLSRWRRCIVPWCGFRRFRRRCGVLADHPEANAAELRLDAGVDGAFSGPHHAPAVRHSCIRAHRELRVRGKKRAQVGHRLAHGALVRGGDLDGEPRRPREERDRRLDLPRHHLLVDPHLPAHDRLRDGDRDRRQLAFRRAHRLVALRAPAHELRCERLLDRAQRLLVRGLGLCAARGLARGAALRQARLVAVHLALLEARLARLAVDPLDLRACGRDEARGLLLRLGERALRRLAQIGEVEHAFRVPWPRCRRLDDRHRS
jgi:SAM-dependent methyltransferase